MENTTTENKMGVVPVGQLLLKMSLPAICSMLFLSLYNIVDSIFVSRVSEKALTAVSLAFPIQNLIVAFAVGLSIGVCSVISRYLGAKREDLVQKAVQTGYVVMLVCTVIFTIAGFTISEWFIGLYTTDSEILEMGATYLAINLIVCLGMFIGTFCEKALQGTGDTVSPMIVQTAGCIFNIVFDPILIFGLFGFPKMGVTGAAVATVAGQFVSMFLGLYYVNKSPYISLKITSLKYDKSVAKDIYAVGFPSVVMQGIGTVMTSLMNGILIAYDIVATTVFGVFFKLQSFVFMPVFGINQGLMPIIGYNFGAKNKERMMNAFNRALIAAFIIMTSGMLIFRFFPHVLLGFFNASDSMLSIGCVALRRISLSFPIASATIILGALFQAIGDGYVSMLTSIVRQIVFLIPCAYLLGKLSGLDALWFSYIIAEVAAIALNVFFYLRNKHKWQF